MSLNSKHQKLDPNLTKMSTEPVVHPSSLFQLCIHYVADHLDFVESFIDFPDFISEQIFKAAEKSSVFRNLPELIAPFCDAYSDLVLRKLSLRQCHLVLGQRLEYFLHFRALTHLDVSSCSLGDEHDIYSHLPNLTRLTHLNMSENQLNDRCLQRLTTRMRMYRNSRLPALLYLDLSGNPGLTRKCLPYLSVFSSLCHLDLSDCGYRSTDQSLVENKLDLIKCRQCCPVTWVTEGWASDVISDWIQDASRKEIKSSTGKDDFYKIRRRPPDVTRVKTDSSRTDDRSFVFCSVHKPPSNNVSHTKTSNRLNSTTSTVVLKTDITKSTVVLKANRTEIRHEGEDDLLMQYLRVKPPDGNIGPSKQNDFSTLQCS